MPLLLDRAEYHALQSLRFPSFNLTERTAKTSCGEKKSIILVSERLIIVLYL
jgi:hypothetical protein